jgi:hypothetical protein
MLKYVSWNFRVTHNTGSKQQKNVQIITCAISTVTHKDVPLKNLILLSLSQLSPLNTALILVFIWVPQLLVFMVRPFWHDYSLSKDPVSLVFKKLPPIAKKIFLFF